MRLAASGWRREDERGQATPVPNIIGRGGKEGGEGIDFSTPFRRCYGRVRLRSPKRGRLPSSSGMQRRFIFSCRSGMNTPRLEAIRSQPMPRGLHPRPASSSLVMPPALVEFAGAVASVAEATNWAIRFGELLKGKDRGSSSKADASPVTAADMALQAFLVRALAERYGAILVVGEESTAVFTGPHGSELRSHVHEFARLATPGESDSDIDEAIESGSADGTSNQHWIIDPIDGTRGYMRGQQYCVCLALVRDGIPVLGLAGCPRLGPRGWLMGAVRGGGTWLWDLGDFSVPPVAMLATGHNRSTLIACESSGASDRAKSRLRRIGELLGAPLSARPMESQCKFVLVAAGEADLAVRLASRERERNRDMVWDYAGAVVFAEEAGAIMTDCDGVPLRFGRGRQIEGNRGILCAAPWLHARAVEACRAADREFEVDVAPSGDQR